MWLKSVAIRAVGACLFVFAQVLSGASPNGRCDFPPSLRSEISKKYPGTRLVRLTDLSEYHRKLFQKDHGTRCPGLIRVNFYGDRNPTWAFVLIAGEGSERKADLVVARHVQQRWEFSLLDTAEGVTPVVWGEAPGEYRDVHGDKKIRATRSVIVFCGYESWAILYAWTGEDVEKIWISD